MHYYQETCLLCSSQVEYISVVAVAKMAVAYECLLLEYSISHSPLAYVA